MIKSLARIQRQPRACCLHLCCCYCCILVFCVCRYGVVADFVPSPVFVLFMLLRSVHVAYTDRAFHVRLAVSSSLPPPPRSPTPAQFARTPEFIHPVAVACMPVQMCSSLTFLASSLSPTHWLFAFGWRVLSCLYSISNHHQWQYIYNFRNHTYIYMYTYVYRNMPLCVVVLCVLKVFVVFDIVVDLNSQDSIISVEILQVPFMVIARIGFTHTAFSMFMCINGKSVQYAGRVK